jgi:hypothetical protein
MIRLYSLFLIGLMLTPSILFAQNIYITHRDYSGSPTVHNLLKLDQSTGSVQSTHAYTTTFTGFGYSPTSLTFSPSSRELVGIEDHTIVFYNIDDQTERSFILPTVSSVDYGDIIVANNRLFVTKRDYSGSPYLHYLVELNLTTGAVVGTPHLYTTTFTNSYSPESLTYLSSSNEIIGISSEKIVKYNISTQAESFFTLATGTGIDYGDVVVGTGRLFVTKRDYSNSPTYVFTFVELNSSTGAIVGTPHEMTTAGLASYQPSSLTYLAASNEIFGVVDEIVVKYNISTGIESSYTLASAASSDYGDMVSIDDGTVTAVVEPFDNKIVPVAVRAWSILGEPLPLHTINQTMIVEYDNGARQKVYRAAE